jgi:hypothetical protein
MLFVRVSRARFLEACGIALLGARVDPRALGSIISHDGDDMTAVRSNRAEAGRHGDRFQLQDARASFFLQHLNTSFSVRSTDGTRARLVLAEVSERPVTKDVEQFSLIFHAPAGAAVRDGTHAFQHPALGDFNLFIVLVGASNPRRTVYQACFSRHRSPREMRCGDAVQGAPPCLRT